MRWQLRTLVLALSVPAFGCTDSADGDDGKPTLPAGSISGQVTAAVDGSAIADATVTTFPLGHSATTNGGGHFALVDLVPGVYLLHVAADGFEAPTPEVVTVLDGGEHSASFSLAALVLFPSTCQECHLQEGLLLASLVDDPPPDATNEGGSAGEG